LFRPVLVADASHLAYGRHSAPYAPAIHRCGRSSPAHRSGRDVL